MNEIRTISQSRHWLCCLGWKTREDGRQLRDGRWCVVARSCGHTLLALADAQEEAWSVACSLALKATRNGWARP